MNIAVRYYSKTGNTKKLAQAIATALNVEMQDVSVPLTEETDIVFLGSAVYAAGIDESVKRFIAENKEKIGTLVNFSTAAVLSSTYKQVQKVAKEHGVKMAEAQFQCRGAFAMLHKGRPNADDLFRAQAFAKDVVALK